MNKSLYLIIALIVALISGVLGFMAGQGRLVKTPLTSTIQSINTNSSIESSKLFQSQTANIQGKITKVSASSISVVDDKNQAGEFTVSKKLVIYKSQDLPVPGRPYTASASADLKSIDLNKSALISLEVIDGSYQVVSISFIPPVLQAPPANAPTAPSP